MMQELKKYQINIFGENYSILSDESEKSISETVALVENHIKEIVSKSNSVDEKKVAIFVALKLASKMRNIESEFNKIKDRDTSLIESISKELAV